MNNILDDFQSITKFDVNQYFNNALNFFNGDYNTISSYFQGGIQSISSSPFNNLKLLQEDTKTMFQLYTDFRGQLKNLKYWIILEQLEEIDNRLSTLSNINKWARSSLGNFSYNQNVVVPYVIPQGKTLERISQDIIGSDDPINDWTNIAIQNNLKEEGYTFDGGTQVNLELKNVNKNFTLSSVVDVIQGKSILGKDINKQFQFVNNDIDVLGYDDTMLQAVGILINLRKNGNPDFPQYGLQTSVLIGSNKATLNFPVINRQLLQTFSSDDSLVNFTITSIKYVDDSMNVEFTVNNRLGETVSQSASLT